jgi:hypothetical protein
MYNRWSRPRGFLRFCLLLSGYQPEIVDVFEGKNMSGERHEQLQYESHGCPFPIG